MTLGKVDRLGEVAIWCQPMSQPRDQQSKLLAKTAVHIAWVECCLSPFAPQFPPPCATERTAIH